MELPEKDYKRFVRSLNKGRKLLGGIQKKKTLTENDRKDFWQRQSELLKEPTCAWYCAMVRDIILRKKD